MKIIALALPLAALLPLSAQDWEVGVFLGQQTYKEPSATEALTGFKLAFNPDKRNLYGVRVGRSIVDLGPVLLQVTAGFQPQVSTTVTANGFNPGQGAIPSTGTFKTQNASLGAMLNFDAFVTVGGGIEYRFENYDFQGQTTTNARPWARFNAGVAFPTPLVKPFVGVEASFPLSSTNLSLAGGSDNELKSMAPKGQVGIYAGIRF